MAGAVEEQVTLRFLAQTSPETERIREDGQLSRQCLVSSIAPRRRQCGLAPQLEGGGKGPEPGNARTEGMFLHQGGG